MGQLFILIAHLLMTLAKLARPGGLGAVAGRIAGGQTPVARHEACPAACAESELMGSAGAGSLCAFGVTPTLEQDGTARGSLRTEGDGLLWQENQPEQARYFPRVHRLDQRNHRRHVQGARDLDVPIEGAYAHARTLGDRGCWPAVTRDLQNNKALSRVPALVLPDVGR